MSTNHSTKTEMGQPKIEVLECKHCGRLAISVDDTRITTHSWAGRGHGGGKCAGAWTILVSSEPEVKYAD